MGTSVVVLGATGYSGGEVLRLLLRHPALTVGAIGGDRRAGESLIGVHPNLGAAGAIRVVSAAEALNEGADAVVACLPAGALEEVSAGIDDAAVVVDLSDGHRFDGNWVYGLTELARPDVRAARRIANPGCYPTAALLCLVPLARAGVIEPPVVVDAISGVSGAGRRAEDRLLFSQLSNSAGAYGAVPHRHVAEIEEGLRFFAGLDATVSFTPHLAPMPRGLLVTARARPKARVKDEDVMQVLRSAYRDEPFIHVIAEWPATKAVAGGNGALVSARVDERAGWVVASAAIDNLGKGAAGQAVQNLNLALGLDEGAGLDAVGVWP
jgi:N-acetyl-gamma-glutamyl-phosphate reductase